MNQPRSQITHYIPEWVLRKFRTPSLYELDIFTGNVELRASKKAGSGRDLWPGDIENRLSEYDNAAARIFRERISEKERIVLSEVERLAFAMWAAYFYVRSPKRIAKIGEFLKQEDLNREGLVEELYREREASIARIKAHNPDAYADIVAELGQERADETVLSYYAHYIVTAPAGQIATRDYVQHHYMRNASVEHFGKILLGYEWVWLYSPHGFVISDDPLVSWHLESRKWEYGIARKGVEITLPLSTNLCLRMQQHPSKAKGQLKHIRLMESRALNCRQRLSAIKYVYGNKSETLDFIDKPIMGWP